MITREVEKKMRFKKKFLSTIYGEVWGKLVTEAK